MLDKKLESAHEIDFQRIRWPIIAVYQGYDEYEGYYVARVWDANRATNLIIVKEELEELQKDIEKHTAMVWIRCVSNIENGAIGVWI